MAERSRAEDLEKRWIKERELKHSLKSDLLAAEAKTDLTIVMQGLKQSNDTLGELRQAFAAHEDRDAQVFAEMLAQLKGLTLAIGRIAK